MTLNQLTRATVSLQAMVDDSPYPPLTTDAIINKIEAKLAVHNNKLITVTNKLLEIGNELGMVDSGVTKNGSDYQLLAIASKKDGIEYLIHRETDAIKVTTYTYDIVKYNPSSVSKFTAGETPQLRYIRVPNHISNNSIDAKITQLRKTMKFQVSLIAAQAILDQILSRLPGVAESLGLLTHRRKRVTQ